ncbi:disulfide bond formation protein B [Dyella silvatica]|uniref:disulfide bond formation protein B n=1 Tax=Dyella silvatica TaxID=2992128 RepID=UPI0022518D11|nr:disulfide bond formation protein B [Dyella silvatica]
MKPLTNGSWALTCAQIMLLGLCVCLAGAFVAQLTLGELPCPLCILQRMAMMLCALGPAMILFEARRGHNESAIYAQGFGLSVLAAILGMAISTRQVLLHILPGDPGYGSAVLGLHLYTWALLVFICVLLGAAVGLLLIGTKGWTPPPLRLLSTLLPWLLAGLIAANLLSVFIEEGLHWVLPDDPVYYQLLK